MKKLLFPVSAIALLVASAFTVVKFLDWKISDNYSIQFTSNDPSGIFRGLKGTVNFDEANLADSKFDVSIDVSTINTGNGMKNTHAKAKSGLMFKNIQLLLLYLKKSPKQPMAMKPKETCKCMV